MKKLSTLFLSLILVLFIGCRKTETIVPDCFTVDFVSGNNQIGSGDGELENPLVVKVKNQDGKVAANIEVTFTTTKGGGYINKSYQSKDVVKTDANGEAQITYLMSSGYSTNTATEHRIKASIAETGGTCTGAKSVEFYAEKAAIRIVSSEISSTKLNYCSNQGSQIIYKHTLETNIKNPSKYVWKLVDEYLFSGQYYNAPSETTLDNNEVSNIQLFNYCSSGSCIKFGSSSYIDDTYTLKIYTKDKAGNPDKLFATSNSTKLRTNKPAGSNRIGVSESQVSNSPTKTKSF